MAVSISFMNPPLGQGGSIISSTTTFSVGAQSLLDATVDMEKGSIHSFSFTSIKNLVTYSQNGSSHDGYLSDLIIPGKTLGSITDGSFTLQGRVFSIGKGVSQPGSVTVCVEDCRGYLRESFIWYSKEPDDYEPEEGEEPEDKFRAKKGDDVRALLAAIAANHNYYMTLCQGLVIGPPVSGNPACMLAISVDPELTNLKLKSDISLDGVSTYDALDMIFEDQGLEWDLSSLTYGINIIAKKKITRATGGGNIVSGVSLKSANKTINVQEMFTAILPLGGYGYNGRRITLSNHDFNTDTGKTGIARGAADQTAIDQIVQVWDSETQRYIDSPDGERYGIIAINPVLVSKFGLHIKTICYDSAISNSDIDDDLAAIRAELVKLAKKDAEKLNTDIVEWSVNAVDLSSVGLGPSYNHLYSLYNIYDSINSIHVNNCRLIKMHKDFADPTNSTFTFETPTGV